MIDENVEVRCFVDRQNDGRDLQLGRPSLLVPSIAVSLTPGFICFPGLRTVGKLECRSSKIVRRSITHHNEWRQKFRIFDMNELFEHAECR